MARKHRATKVSLQAFLKDKDEAVRQAAADALNKAADELKNEMIQNLSKQGIEQKTGRLVASVELDYATAKRPRVLIKSEAFVDAPALDRQGLINPGMKGRYGDNRAPYGRFIEFSPRIKKPWFYTAWYDRMASIKQDIIQEISKAWKT